MENNNESYEDILWNKYDHLQKRLIEKSLYYQSTIKYFKDVYNEIDKHKINLELINNEGKLNKPTKLDEIFNIFKDFMKFFLESHKKLINRIITNLQRFVMGIKKENPIYSDFKQFFHNYQIEQRKFNQIKEKFHESALEAETKTLKKVQKKNEKKTNELVDLSKKLKKEVGINLKKYQTSITELNKKREEYNSKQTDLIKYYVDTEKKELIMYYSILNDFLKIEIEKIIKYFYQDKFNNLSEKNKNKDIDKELEESLKKMKSNEKKDEKISFEYKSNIDFDKCLENEDFNAYAETVDIIKKNFNNIYEGITLEKEKLKNNIRELIKKFFELDKVEKSNEIKEEDEKLYFNSLNDPSTHPTFIKLMTKLRTNSKFNRQKKLIEILGKSFKIVLDEGEKNTSYWAAKNCIILSQTFYYDDVDEYEKKIKKYAFEYIKNDSWLTKKEFWIGYNFWIVEEELIKLEQLFPDITLEGIKNNKNFTPKKNNKISDIIFSQLLPSLTNMLEITKNNMYAIEIIELFHNKYSYLSEENMQCLFQLVSTDKEDIERMRNEYNKSKKGNNKIDQNNDEKKDKEENNTKIMKLIDMEENNKIINDKEQNNLIINDKEQNNLIINDKEENNKIINDKEQNNLIINDKEENNKIINDKEENNKIINDKDNNINIIINHKEDNLIKLNDQEYNELLKEKKQKEFNNIKDNDKKSDIKEFDNNINNSEILLSEKNILKDEEKENKNTELNSNSDKKVDNNFEIIPKEGINNNKNEENKKENDDIKEGNIMNIEEKSINKIVIEKKEENKDQEEIEKYKGNDDKKEEDINLK